MVILPIEILDMGEIEEVWSKLGNEENEKALGWKEAFGQLWKRMSGGTWYERLGL